MRCRGRALLLMVVLAGCARTVPGSGDIAPEDGGRPSVRPDASVFVGHDAGTPTEIESEPELTLGAPNRILLTGQVITPDIAYSGEVLVEDGLITCAQPGDVCGSQPGATGATIIRTNGVISPGLIDTHNHILFDIFDGDDWLPAHQYTNHNQWPKEPRYQAMLDVKQCLEDASQGRPTWCPAKYQGTGNLRCEMDKWGELKGLIAGTTSIVGLAGRDSPCFGSLARSIDTSNNGLGSDRIQTSSLFPPSKSSADGVCSNFDSGKTSAYLIHCGEGTDATSRQEFATLGSVSTTPQCLYSPRTVITHGVAFTADEFDTMSAQGMKLTWSPASNIALYGATTDIPTALDAGVLVTLAPDWSMGGSQNLLDELRTADAWDNSHWGDRLSAKDLVRMTTINAAQALGFDDKIGQIKEGLVADLVVLSGDTAHPYEALLAATPREVRLTMVGGQVLYGDAALKPMGPAAPGCEDLNVCGTSKFVCVATSDTTNKLGQTYAEIQSVLETALEDADSATPGDGWNFAPLTPLVRCQ